MSKNNAAGAFSLVIVSSALLLVAAACGGGSNGGDNVSTGSASPAQESPGGSSKPSDQVAQKLNSLSSEWARTSTKATYSIVSTANGQTSNGSLTLYWAPPRVRVDTSTDTGGTNTQTIAISTPDNTYRCSRVGGDKCLAYPAATNILDVVPYLRDFDAGAIEAQISGFTSDVQIESSDETVSGHDASCVSANDMSEQGGVIKWCYAANGLLLLESSADTAGTAEFTFQVSDIGEVSDSDFQPPYSVTQAPSESPTGVPESPSATPGG